MRTDFPEISYRYFGNWAAALILTLLAFVSAYALFAIVSESINSDRSLARPAIALVLAAGFIGSAAYYVSKELGVEPDLVLTNSEIIFPRSMSSSSEKRLPYAAIHSIKEEGDDEGAIWLVLEAHGFRQKISRDGFEDYDSYESFKMNLEERVQAFNST